MRLTFAVSLLALAAGTALPAAAQTGNSDRAEADATQDTAAGTTAAGTVPEEDAGVADIVVTAQRRTESVQDSSLSIDVVSSAEVTNSGLSQPEGLSRLVPNLQIGSFVFARIYLRGVGDNTVNGFAQSAVAFNVDNVHVARATQFAGNFYDIARIEVLKGPQGTLYGRNASAGVINVLTNEPGREFGGNLLVNVGNYDLFQVQGALNVPVSDTLAIRGAFNLVRRDGYLEDGYNDDRQQSGRIRLLWRPNADISLGIRADYTHVGGMGQASVVFPTPTGADPWMAASGDLVRSYQIATGAPRVPDDGFVDNDYASISAELNANLGFAELTVIPAYRWQDFEFYSSTAGTLNFGERDRVDQHSLEVRLAKNTERFNLVVGGFYFREVTRADGRIEQGARLGATTGFSAIRTFYRAPTEAIAAFADGRVSLTDEFRLLAGIRYTDETRGLFGETTTYANIPSVPLCPAAILPDSPDPTYIYCLRARADNEVTNDAVTWRVGAEFDLGPQSMAYARVDRGFKSGGIFSGAAPGNDYRPEFLTSYAGGIRNRFFDNRLQLNVEGFYWDYTDYQFTFVNFDERGVSALVTRNVGAARIYGGSVDVVYRPSPRDTLTFNVEYLNARFTSFVYTTPQASDPNRECAALGVVGQVTPPGRPPVNLFGYDCAGIALPRAPKWQIRAGWNHEFPLANGAAIVADVDGQFSSSYKLDLTRVAFLTQDPFVLLNAQLTYRSPDERWTVSAWVRNLTNEAVYNDARRYGSTNFAGADIRPPRTFGVRGTLAF